MKQLLNFMRWGMRPLAGLFILSLVFTACKKNDVEYPRTPVAALMAFNLAPDKSAVGFSLSGNQFGNAALNYTGYTGTYLPIFVGTREVRSVDLNSGSTIAFTNGSFADSMYYSAFVLGTTGNYRNVVVKDNLDSLTATAGKAWVRFVNAIPDSSSIPVVTIGNDGSEPAAYATVSAFKQVDAGTVSSAINNNSNISVSRNITLEQNKIYTVLFVGRPGQADSSQAVQIKFIQNGSIQ